MASAPITTKSGDTCSITPNWQEIRFTLTETGSGVIIRRLTNEETKTAPPRTNTAYYDYVATQSSSLAAPNSPTFITATSVDGVSGQIVRDANGAAEPTVSAWDKFRGTGETLAAFQGRVMKQLGISCTDTNGKPSAPLLSPANVEQLAKKMVGREP